MKGTDDRLHEILQKCIDQARVLKHTGKFELSFNCNTGGITGVSSTWHQKGLLKECVGGRQQGKTSS